MGTVHCAVKHLNVYIAYLTRVASPKVYCLTVLKMASQYVATATAPVNIATLKYWGKRDAKLNLPTNSSISVTLAQKDLRATTTARVSPSYIRDELWLNGNPEEVDSKPRTRTVIDELKQARFHLEESDSSKPKISSYKLQIVSENNFPTAAGLASSAAGFAALVKAVAELYELPYSASDLSVLARQGSGSACRSLFGGYAAWEMGSRADGSDSRAVEIAPLEHWPEMRAAILVASASKKAVSSTTGMQVTVNTSPLFKHRVNKVVPERFDAMKSAILNRDFASFADLTMRDSNQFHAVCLDSNPPIFYMNDTSRAAVRIVETINERAGKIVAAYTFDAGPNCVVYFLAENEPLVLGGLGTLNGVPGFPTTIKAVFETPFDEVLREGTQRVILTQVGPGPQRINEDLPEVAT